jgi:enamine deaminase RidA (YjgF/YER057c/UK114 family)
MSREPLSVGKPWEKTIAFSLGVVSSGRLLHTSGITARDPNGTLVGVGDIRSQIEQCFKNVGDVLRAAGADFDDVVKWTMYTTDIEGFNRAGDLWRSYFKDRPASTLVEVRRLVHPDMLVEIEAVAVLE